MSVKKKSALEVPAPSTITNSHFYGVYFDAKAVSAIQTIAEGLKVNAESLGKLTEVLKAGNVSIEAMVRIGR